MKQDFRGISVRMLFYLGILTSR